MGGQMAKLALVVRVLRYTKNFWQVPLLKQGTERKKIHFRNGVSMELDLAGYRKIRDLFCMIDEYKFMVVKSKNGFFVTKSQPVFSCAVPPPEKVAFFNFLISLSQNNWVVNQADSSTFQISKQNCYFQIRSIGDSLYAVQSDKFLLTGPVESLMAYFLECQSGVYDYNYRGKTVLDIGAFCGESAVYFASQGAEKIIVYEPVKEHHELIRKNIVANGVNAELHEEGLGAKNGSLTISYEDTGLGFGLLSKGNKTCNIEVKSAQKIIMQSQADIAKIDCEGAEVSLLGLPPEILRLVSFYIIETHTRSIQDQIRKKFLECGFSESKLAKQLEGEIYVLYFQKPS
jgi:FkbM family methyltransferase